MLLESDDSQILDRRDLFAAAALIGLLSGGYKLADRTDKARLAYTAYEIGDAMSHQREWHDTAQTIEQTLERMRREQGIA
ncbi:MAG: hypothetical protein ACOY3P_15415 [Planctomycetota bacterium]